MHPRLFVASLGNPATTFQNTLHSAGHTLLHALQQNLNYPAFTKSRAHGNGLISHGAEFTLWQSPTLMNVSGPAVAAAWKAFIIDLPSADRPGAKLVVVHDELESSLGMIKTRNGGSARGHNGLKSVKSSLGGEPYMRIGVGIGRPRSRESCDVAHYVVKKMSAVELQKIRDAVGSVAIELGKIKDGSYGSRSNSL